MKYRIPVSSYILLEAETQEGAVREFMAMKEALAQKFRIPHDEEKDMFLNSEVDGRVEIEEPWQE